MNPATSYVEPGRAAFSLRDWIPNFVTAAFRGVGQVFFQENALTGAFFVAGIALSSPLMAAGAVGGALIGTLTAQALKFDEADTTAGIYGFNAALAGIATLFFFQPRTASIACLIVGCVAATVLTMLARRFAAFPTYTAPFVVITWIVFLAGNALALPAVAPGPPLESARFAGAVARGVAQVMFQASIWTGLLFLIGIALNNWRHALWVAAASTLGALVGSYHLSGAARALDVERLIEMAQTNVVALGLYGFNATLAAVALYLARPSFIPPLLGALLTVPLAEFIPTLGVPALTAPFVIATWIVLGLEWCEERLVVKTE
jgi:urea transporter